MKKRKPWYQRLLSWLLGTIVSTAIAIGVFFGVVYFKYGINLLDTIKQVKQLAQEVNVAELAPYSYSQEDLSSAKTVADISLEHLIDLNTETNKYEIPGTITSTEMNCDLKFTDKQIGAILGNLLNSQEKIEITLGSVIDLKQNGFELLQTQFSNVTENFADLNVVIKVDLNKLKDKMSSFPLSLLKKYVPDKLYISSTSTIIHDEAIAFKYGVTSKSMSVNSLSTEQTEKLFEVAEKLLKISMKDFNLAIGQTFANMLVGTEQNPGLAYSLKDVAKDYAFVVEDGINYFVIQKKAA